MKSAMEVIEAAKHLEESRFLSSKMLAFFQSNEEDIQSLLSKIETIKMDMCDRINSVWDVLDLLELQEQDRKVRASRQVPAYQLYDICEHEIQIEDFYLVIATIITPKGWRFKVFARKLWNRPVERDNQRAISWYKAQTGPRTFPYNAEPSEVAAQLQQLIESAMTDPFPLPEQPSPPLL